MSLKRIIFFTPELSGYFFYNLKYFSQHYDVEIMVFFYPFEKDAPYKLDFSDDIIFKTIESNNKEEIKKLSVSFNPDMVVIVGWNDKLFRSIGKLFKQKSVPVVMPIDNLWKKTLKQRVFLAFGKYFIKSFADYIWVPGYPQYYYVKKLGFKDNEIIFNYYNGNYLNKNDLAKKCFPIKEKKYPKTIVFVGRFVEYKNPDILAEVFAEIQQEFQNEWKLILIGNGSLKDKIEKIDNPNIEVRNFMQPDELNEFIVKQGVFCLPSHNEHWGLVVHEAASVGMPMVLSDSVGSASTFLINGYNGFVFKSNNKESLKQKLLSIMKESDENLLKMGKKSLELSNKINCEIWASSILSVIK